MPPFHIKYQKLQEKHLSIVAGLVVRHGDLAHEGRRPHGDLTMLIECDKSHVSLPSCNN